MKKVSIGKRFIFVILCLFIGAAILPSISSNINEVKQVEKINSTDLITSLTDGLVGYWSFNEKQGSIAYDLSGMGNDGLIHNATYGNGISGSALQFDFNDDDYVLVPDDESLNLSTSLTIGAWIKSSDTGGARTIVSKWNDNTSNHSYIFKDHNDDDKLRIELQKGYLDEFADLKGTTSIVLNEWIYVATTFDSNTVKLYYNGKEDGSQQAIGTIAKSVANVIIGGMTFADNRIWENFHGYIDEVRIYNRVLNESEIQYLHDNPDGGNQPPEKPTITGETKGEAGKEYDYKFQAIDPEGEWICYLIDWGDGNTSGWLGPYDSGYEASVNHSWSKKGSYTIKAKTIDAVDHESDWATITVIMPNSCNPLQQFLELLFQRFTNRNQKIEPEGKILFTARATGPCVIGWNDEPTWGTSPFSGGYIESGKGFVINFGTMPYHNINSQLTNYFPEDNNEEVLWKVNGKTLVSINWQHGEINHHLQIICRPQETTCGTFFINYTAYFFACPRGPGGIELEELASKMLAFTGVHRNGSKTESIKGSALFVASSEQNLTSPSSIIGMWLLGANNNGEVEFFHALAWAKNECDWMGITIPKANTFHVNYWTL